MTDLHPKFIIEDGRLILGKVEYHEHLSTDLDKVQGGGWFHYSTKKDLFILYGKSAQFGAAAEEDIVNAIKKGFVDSKDVSEIYSNENFAYCKTDYASDAIANYRLINKE